MICLRKALCFAAFFFAAACSNPPVDAEENAQPPLVAVEPVLSSSVSAGIDGVRHFVGRLAALSTVDISFEVGGKLTDLPVREGDVVQKEKRLAALDPVDYEIALEKARAAADLSAKDLGRKQELARSGTVSQAALDQARAENRLRQAELENAKRDLRHTIINAPFDALITRRLVDPQTNVQAGTAVLRIQDVSQLLVRISVPEDLMRRSQSEGSFKVVAVASGGDGKEYRFPLKFRENNTEPDPVTQTFTVTFTMDRPAFPNLLPGMTVTVEISAIGQSGFAAVSVPVSAIISRPDGQHIVWVCDAKTRTVSARAVELGPIADGRITILSGLQPGETVVVAGAHLIHDGMKVRTVSNM